MKPWLDGQLAGVDLRAELDRLRGVALAAAHRGADLRAFFAAVGARDPTVCADLATGPRAISHPRAVEGALAAASALESVLEPAALYGRLLDLAPDLAPTILRFAFGRHPTAAWAVRLSRQHDPVPGQWLLTAAAGARRLDEAADLLAQHGVVEGLLAWAETGDITPIRALWAADRRRVALAAAAACLDARPTAPVVPALAAWTGPELAGVLRALLPLVRTGPALERVRWALVDVG